MKLNRHPGILCAGAGLLTLTACGLEDIFVDAIYDAPPIVQEQIVQGALNIEIPEGLFATPTLYLYDVSGNELFTGEPAGSDGSYTLQVDSSMAMGILRLVAVSGNTVMKALICLRPDNVEAGLEVRIDKKSTTATLVAEALGTYRGDAQTNYALQPYGLAAYAGDELNLAYDNTLAAIDAQLEAGEGTAYQLYQYVSAVIDTGDGNSTGTSMFPIAASSGALLQQGFLDDTEVDYDGDGEADKDPAVFDAAAGAVAGEARAAIDTDIEPAMYTDANGATYRMLRTILTVHIHEGIESGNCSALALCGYKTIVCDDGDTMFFTGGIHSTSPIQDPAIHEQLGAFIPNTEPLQMYDDGIHGGDEIAGDEIYTLTLDLPETLRIGYKYTWGQAGQTWTGTEEWPGNQRLLEIADLTGDGYVWRDDSIADEASNKDKSNCYYGSCTYTLQWGEDLNGDGFPETGEHPLAATELDAEQHLVTLTGQCPSEATLYDVYPSRTTRATASQCE